MNKAEKLTPTIHIMNVYKRYKPIYLWEEVKVPNQYIQNIPLPRNEHDLVPWGEPVIYNIQEKGTAVELLRKSPYPHTQYPTGHTIGIPKLPVKNHLI